MRLATTGQSREIETLSCQAYSLTGEVLMEAAGQSSYYEIEQSYLPELKKGGTAIVCGPGNNGGDGLVLARHLHSNGFRDLTIFMVQGGRELSDLCRLQLQRAQAQGIKTIALDEHPEKLESLQSAFVIVDALFGIGLTRPVEGFFSKVIEAINRARRTVISLDTPSGLNCDRGTVWGHSVKANMTLTFGLAKPGFFVAEGPALVGRLRVCSIGFPYECVRGVANQYFLFTEKLARRYLPRRKDRSNKSDHGNLVVLAGSAGMWGAGVLASSSAYRMGAGYVSWGSFEAPSEGLKDAPEILTFQISEENWHGRRPANAVAIGPGLGVDKKVANLVEKLKGEAGLKVVVDADAITVCVREQLFPLPGQWVITPHAGELSRILGAHTAEVEENRFEAAMEAARRTGCHVLLKGFRSILAYRGRIMTINSGNSALAKAGTGDVLTGMIGGLLAQNLDTLQATATAAYIHGRLADEWVRSGNPKQSLNASDLRVALPQVMGRLQGGVLT